MARPQKNNADYFPHDANMRDDPKIKALRARHGLTGYAIWCILLETLTDADNFILQWDDLTIELTAGDIGIPAPQLIEIIEYMKRINLIEIDENNKLYTLRHHQRMLPILETRERKRMWKLENQTKATAKIPSTDISDGEIAQSKIKESKLNKSKLNPSNEGESNAPAREERNFQNQQPTTNNQQPTDQIPLPDQIRATIAAWAESDNGLPHLKRWKRECEYRDSIHGKTTLQLLRFVGHHFKGPDRDRLIANPINHFIEQFPGWLAIAVQKKNQNNGNARPYKPGDPKSIADLLPLTINRQPSTIE